GSVAVVRLADRPAVADVAQGREDVGRDRERHVLHAPITENEQGPAGMGRAEAAAVVDRGRAAVVRLWRVIGLGGVVRVAPEANGAEVPAGGVAEVVVRLPLAGEELVDQLFPDEYGVRLAVLEVAPHPELGTRAAVVRGKRPAPHADGSN